MLGAVSQDSNPDYGEAAYPKAAPEREESVSTTLSSITVVLAEADATLADVERSLDRLESGEYGTCELCGQPIPQAIRTESPLARRCGAHAN